MTSVGDGDNRDDAERTGQAERANAQGFGGAFLAIDREGKIVAWDEGAQRLFRRPSAQVVGGPASLVISAIGGGAIVLADVDGDLRLADGVAGLALDGQRFAIELATTRLWVVGERVLGVVARLPSVRGDKEMVAIRQMAASVGHGLRNPLGAIRNAWYFVAVKVRAAAGIQDDARVAQFLDIVDVELRRCAQVVTDLFEFASDVRAQRAPVHLRKLIDDAMGNVLAPATGVAIDNQVPDALPLVNADPTQLRLAMLALIQNAVEAVPSEAGRVEIRAHDEGDTVVLEVHDNGAGVPQSARERLFAPLFTTKLKGTGLGLAIVDAVVRRHDGTVSVGVSDRGGALFRVQLPRTT